jgi:maltose alpha-D-glucosyltransferase / alpha-amylase
MAVGRKHRLDADPLWYKDAVIYQLHVKSFFDANNDGVGDFAGLMAKLDYLTELGVNAVWLLPFYPSPRRDDGYDIADYKGVHPEYGTMADVRRFIDEAHSRNIRVITELVLNHTSDRHPWFQRARRAKPGSASRNFYVWSDNATAYTGTRIIFLDTEKSNWSWDDQAQAYYWHRFYSHQPDLNYDNPRVLAAMLGVLRFWLDAGVDGLRLDAVPYLIEREGTNNENLPETHAILKRIRAEVDAHYKGRMLLAEANQWPEDVQAYFGNDDECHMLFHFPLMPRMYMAIAQEDRFPITDILRQTPDTPDDCQWAIFLRNHDELTLEMVTDKERDYLWNFYAADSRARLNLGIRRRLAPLLEHDRRRIELMNSLLLTMPGTPVLYYGDEIGMGDNLHLGDRDGVRTPMQWTPDRNGGFSRADPAALILPPIMDPIYGYEAVNVEAQWRDAHSLLNWVRRMLVVRGRHKAFGRGSLRFLRPQNRKVLAYLREYEGETILCVVNVSRAAQAVELDLAEFVGRIPVEMLGGVAFPLIGHLSYLLTLPPYGFYWFYLSASAEPPSWSTATPGPPAELHTFVLRDGLPDVLEASARDVLEEDILPKYIAQRRWYQGKGAEITTVRIIAACAAPPAESDFLFADVKNVSEGAAEVYTLPLAIAWEDMTASPFEAPLALARVRRRSRVGYLTDGFASLKFVRAILGGLSNCARLPFGAGELVFTPAAGFDIIVGADIRADWPGAEQSNSSLIIERAAVVKLFRRSLTGIHPEAEMIRLLTGRGFSGIAALLGEVTRVASDGAQSLMAIVQRFVANQGNGFRWTVDQLKRLLTEHPSDSEPDRNHFRSYENFANRLGTRLGEMHAVLAQASGEPAFAPEIVDAATVKQWTEHARHQIETAFSVLAESGGAKETTRTCAIAALDARRSVIIQAIEDALLQSEGMAKTRIHGDLHLGQVLVAAGDVVFTDFEGEPLKSLEERRAKNSPLRDVAGMLRSFDYAARVAQRESRTLEGEAGEGRAGALLAEFRHIAAAAFLQSYGKARGAALDSRESLLLAAFGLEKAAYEIVYEATNRPDWIAVPMEGFVEMAEQLTRTPE